MSTKLIGALFVVLALWMGYRFYNYYQEVSAQRYEQKQQASRDPGSLPGVPYQLETGLKAAQIQGASGLKQWLRIYGDQIQDPRKASIQLDYCTLVARHNPQEAKAVFNTVKERLKENSPVYPRLKQLEKSFD